MTAENPLPLETAQNRRQTLEKIADYYQRGYYTDEPEIY
jgi:hypothetical protein